MHELPKYTHYSVESGQLLWVVDHPQLFQYERETRLRDIYLGYAGWGDHQELNPREAGFSGRYFLAPEVAIDSQDTQSLHRLYTTALAIRGIRARGWDRLGEMNRYAVDELVVASSSSTDSIAQDTATYLASLGISVGHTQFYGLACHGLMGGVLDLAKKYQDSNPKKRLMVIAVDSISGNFVGDADPDTQKTFGNGGAVMAFESGEIRVLDNLKSYVVEDRAAVLSVPRYYNLATDGVDASEEVEFAKENTRVIYSRTPDGARILMPEKDHMVMNRMGTTLFFGKNLPPRIVAGIKYYFENLYDTYGLPVTTWMHQANIKVLEFTVKHVYELMRKGGMDPATIASLEFPWVMDTLPINNVSAATSGIQLTELVLREKVRPGDVLMTVGFGIGGIIKVGFIQIAA